MARLTEAQAGGATSFPTATLAITYAEEAPPEGEAFAEALERGRWRDMAAGRSLTGPHRADLEATYAAKGVPAGACSTGEQKALLLRLVLAHAGLVERMSGLAPLVLLDEVAAHLDPGRRFALFEALEGLGGQVWMTGADPALFADLAGRADLIRVAPGRAERA